MRFLDSLVNFNQTQAQLSRIRNSALDLYDSFLQT